LRKCFDAVTGLEFGEKEQMGEVIVTNDILAMVSPEGEVIELTKVNLLFFPSLFHYLLVNNCPLDRSGYTIFIPGTKLRTFSIVTENKGCLLLDVSSAEICYRLKEPEP
jgi:hypothetical protein